jgi:hypothetical protein
VRPEESQRSGPIEDEPEKIDRGVAVKLLAPAARTRKGAVLCDAKRKAPPLSKRGPGSLSIQWATEELSFLKNLVALFDFLLSAHDARDGLPEPGRCVRERGQPRLRVHAYDRPAA